MITWHKHHIVPRHAGGDDSRGNLLKCNVAMHAFMHEQRYRELGDEYDRIAAAALRGQISKTEATKQAYWACWNDDDRVAEIKRKLREANLGKTYSDEVN